MNNRWLHTLLLPLLLTLLAAGLLRLLYLRFEPGDVYPPYSTLRSDPMGAKALFTAFEESGKVTVARNLRDLPKIEHPETTTFFVLGLDRHDLGPVSKKEAELLEQLVNSGGTLVLAFTEVKAERKERKDTKEEKDTKAEKETDSDQDKKSSDESKEKKADGKSKKKTDEDSEEEELFKKHTVNLRDKWDIRLATHTITTEKESDAEKEQDEESILRFDAKLNPAFPGKLPSTLVWHSALRFELAPDKWYAVYTVDDRAVLAVRELGRGRIILVSDAYLLSNEALRADPQPALLAWLAGASTRLIFDESHHGIHESTTIATLGRRYRLEGFAAGMLVLFALFIWKNTVSFLPHDRANQQKEVVVGRDAFSGFVNLLYHHLPARQTLTLCVEEWEKSFAHKRPHSAEQLRRARALLEEDKRTSVVLLYEKLRQLFSEKWK